MEEYVYCKNDIVEAIRDSLKECFGYELIEFIQEKAIENLENYVNLYRFYDRNCCGCVAGNRECDFAYGKNEAKGAWEKAKRGELFDCPVRTNGTMFFDPAKKEEGLHSIDISDRNKTPYPIVEAVSQRSK